MSSVSYCSIIFSFGGLVIVIVCQQNNDGFVSVGVKSLNNYGGREKLLNVCGGCRGGGGIKLLNVGGCGGGRGG